MTHAPERSNSPPTPPAGRIARLRLRQKILLFGVLPLLVLYAIVGVTVVSLTYDALRKDGERALTDRANSLGAAIDSANVEAITVPKTMALAQSSGMFGQRAATLDYAKALLPTAMTQRRSRRASSRAPWTRPRVASSRT